MPGKDYSRWQQNADGSWTRRTAEGNEETTYYKPPSEEIAIDATAGAVSAAAELGVDLATISGTGKDGKITKADVEAAAKEA